MIDVARLLLMNTSPEVRKELEKDGRLLKQYLEVHRTEGGQNQFDLEKVGGGRRRTWQLATTAYQSVQIGNGRPNGGLCDGVALLPKSVG